MLVELMAVIAIIAILVSLIVPTIQKENIKAAAAANAANLRSVVGKLAAMKASNEDDFAANYEANIKSYGTRITDALDPLLGWLGWDNFSNWADELLYESTADDAGNLYWRDSNKVIMGGVPGAQALTVKDSNGNQIVIKEGAPMSVYITDTAIAASYYIYGTDDKLGIEDFADIAEDGVYDGGVINSSEVEKGWWEGMEDWAAINYCKYVEQRHNPDPNNGCFCNNCHQVDHVRNSNSYHNCACGKPFNVGHTETGWDDDYICDYYDCTTVIHPESHQDGGDHTCEVPGCNAYKKQCPCTEDTTGCRSGCTECSHGKHASVHYETTWTVP